MELLGALGDVSPLIATIVVITLLMIMVIEKLLGVNGPFTRAMTWLATRELNRERRARDLDEQIRLRADGQMKQLIAENTFWQERAVATTAQFIAQIAERDAQIAELHQQVGELTTRCEETSEALETNHRLLDALRRDLSAANARIGIPDTDPPEESSP